MVNAKMLIFDFVVLAYVAIAAAMFIPWILLYFTGPASLSGAVTGDIYSFFSLFCHQLPWRSLFYDGVQFPVCARCTSIYIATALGLIFFRLKGYGAREFHMNWLLLVLLFVPTGLDGTTQLLGWRESTNDLRLITGIPYGLGYAYLLAWILPFLYAMLELIVVALKKDSLGADKTLERIKKMAWPFTIKATKL